MANDVGTREFRITDSPLDIMNKLREVYGPLTPTERMNMENKWAEIWNPAVPIEAYFKQLKDIYEQALAHPPRLHGSADDPKGNYEYRTEWPFYNSTT